MADPTLIPPVTGNPPIINRQPGQKHKRDKDEYEPRRKPKRGNRDKGKGRRIDEFA